LLLKWLESSFRFGAYRVREKSDYAEFTIEQMTEMLRRIERRVEALEQWQQRAGDQSSSGARVLPDDVAVRENTTQSEPMRERSAPPGELVEMPVARIEPIGDAQPDEMQFDLSLIGRTLIVFGGAYLLRAVTEAGYLPASAGVVLGLLYAVSWSLFALRPSVSRLSAGHHGVATTFTALPLIFEATRRFDVLGPWSSALALTLVSATVLVMVWRRRLHGVAWTFTLSALAVVPLLMAATSSVVPFILYLTLLGVAMVWIGYVLEWGLLRWAVALEINLALVLLVFLVVTDRIEVSAATAIGVSFLVFAAYLSTFAVRTLLRARDVVPFEIVQTFALVATALGGAMWVAASRATLEIPLAAAMFGLAAASYVVSFAFIPRRAGKPANFVFYSSLALILIVAGGTFVTSGLPGSLLWVTLALIGAYLSSHYRKASLALHSAVYLFCGFAGAGVLELGMRALFLKVDQGWLIPTVGAVLLFLACAIAASVPPIERNGTFQLWNAAKVMILAESGWITAALVMSSVGFFFLNATEPDAAIVSVVRTAVLGALAVITAWASRFVTLSPARLLTNPILGVLVVKLMWEDFRFGRPSTLFLSLAIVGAAFILTTRLRRSATAPQPAIIAMPVAVP
jgi:hypothetical protein